MALLTKKDAVDIAVSALIKAVLLNSLRKLFPVKYREARFLWSKPKRK